MTELLYNTPNAKLYLGDAGKLDFLEDESVDLVCTSAPYNIGDMNKHHWSPKWYGSHEDVQPQEEYEAWQIEVLKEWYRVVVPGGCLAYVHKLVTRDYTARHPYRWLSQTPWQFVQEIIWERQSTVQHDEGRLWDNTERVYWLSKGKPKYFNTKCDGYGTVWRIRFESKPSVDHPAPFPYALASRIIECFSQENSVVLDPFAGSCTTVMAARDMKRIGIGVDIDRKYLEDSMTRLQKEVIDWGKGADSKSPN